MFWLLYLPHLIADYPLQTDRIVQLKRTWNGLFVHVGVHLLVVLAFTWGHWKAVFPYVFGLVVIHYGIDTFKNFLRVRRPKWVIGPYFFDQALHLLSILLIAGWIDAGQPGRLPVVGTWMVYASGYLLATHIWFITERILFHLEPEYVTEVTAKHWPRMAVRGMMLTVILLVAQAVSAAVSFALVIPYVSGSYRRRVFWIDLTVALACGVFILWAR